MTCGRTVHQMQQVDDAPKLEALTRVESPEQPPLIAASAPRSACWGLLPERSLASGSTCSLARFRCRAQLVSNPIEYMVVTGECPSSHIHDASHDAPSPEETSLAGVSRTTGTCNTSGEAPHCGSFALLRLKAGMLMVRVPIDSAGMPGLGLNASSSAGASHNVGSDATRGICDRFAPSRSERASLAAFAMGSVFASNSASMVMHALRAEAGISTSDAHDELRTIAFRKGTTRA
eukprot:CAMPEP_0181197360 /NCGR_PEP_ID=MMETSP1096-20121128/15994_1 /TAXON_ID=156174 ORGANISM="Chrysochromulina ericina, Strain CCMP281" /NCGR_SAMPLE_ID=MMETSP1096 /ASSEMBLY_ACC=CAM_ASM_000453 /LENGTH=233 /DNA_ID=CAMNT_0023287255 /DNA_START=103 /DNA_END=805 /DNA_ORIENTATION=+